MQFNHLRFLPTLLFLLVCSFFAAAQNLRIDVGFTAGGSMLFHNTRFQETSLNAQYEIIQEVKRRDGETYAWEDFESDFGLNQQFMQPRFGFTAHVTYKDWPVVAIAEALSSPSGYTKMTYAGTVGFGKTFFNWDTSMNFSFLAGYKYVLDEGFGSNTIINSVRDDFMRERLSTFFNPTNPLGRKLGNLLVVRGGVGKVFGWEQEWSAGVDVYGELDLLEKSVRFSRMTNVGAMLWLRYRL
jgi:hypothetical protein